MKTNNHNKIYLIQLIKKIILPILFIIALIASTTSCTKNKCTYSSICTIQDSINVSTGLDSSGNTLIGGGVDFNWTATTSPYLPSTIARKIPDGSVSVWQLTPIVNTQAGWINCKGFASGNIAGNYTFERSFSIPAGTTSFNTAFGISQDDSLVGIELIDPSLNVIPLTVPAHPTWQLSPNINRTITNPVSGVWRIRFRMLFIDGIGGFLLSGHVVRNRPC